MTRTIDSRQVVQSGGGGVADLRGVAGDFRADVAPDKEPLWTEIRPDGIHALDNVILVVKEGAKNFGGGGHKAAGGPRDPGPLEPSP